MSVVTEIAKQGNDFRTLNKVLADEDIEQVLKQLPRALGERLENVSRAVREALMRSSSRLSSGKEPIGVSPAE